MSADHEKGMLSPEERHFIERVTANYTPPPLTPAQRAAFDRALQERLARPRHSLFFFRPLMIMAPACVALLLWFATSAYRTGQLDIQPVGESPVKIANANKQEATSLLLFAYDDPDLYGDEDDEEKESFLPDEYEALTTVFFPADV